MEVGVALFATPMNLYGIRKLTNMNDKKTIQFEIIIWFLYFWITVTIFWNYFR